MFLVDMGRILLKCMSREGWQNGFIAPDLKSGGPTGPGGSNPSPSANNRGGLMPYCGKSGCPNCDPVARAEEETWQVQQKLDELLSFIRDDLCDLADAIGSDHWIEQRRLELISDIEFDRSLGA